jgi:peptidoglycan hydrolase-like protein with peptidoglycan-binding domain
MAILLRGLQGEPVKRLQEKLGVDADGIFGPGTEKAVKDYQKSNGLSVDGIAGPDTFASMGLKELILLKRGSRGGTVKKMQEKLGIDADGKFGPGTEAAVKKYQEENGLTVDGLAGPATLAKMGLFGISQSSVAASVVGAGENIWDTITEATEGALSKVKSFFGM